MNHPTRATQNQKAAARNLMLNASTRRHSTLRDLLIASGYSTLNAANNAQQILTSPGVVSSLEALGFNEEVAKAMVAEILFNGEEQNRLKAAELVFKVRGSFAPEHKVVTGVIGHIIKEIENDDTPLVVPQ